jgi:hypothetical protein
MQLLAITCLLCAVFATVYGQSSNVTIQSVTTNATANAFYKEGDAISITLNFNGTVILSADGAAITDPTDVATISLTNGDDAYYVSGNNTAALTFVYVLDSSIGTTTTDLDITTNAVTIGSGADSITLFGPDDLEVDTTVVQPGIASFDPFLNLNVTVDFDAPTVDQVIFAGGNYNISQVVPLYVVFDEDVVVTGVPTITILGLTFEYVQNNTNANILEFDYTVVSTGDGAVDLSSLSLSTPVTIDFGAGVSITDQAGNVFDNTTDLVTDVAAALVLNPVVINEQLGLTTVLSVSAAQGDSDVTLNVGDGISIVVTFSRPVAFLGLSASNTVTLLLNNGGVATLDSTSNNTDALVFDYTVQAGDGSTNNLDVASANALTLGGAVTIIGAANIDLSLPFGSSDENSLYQSNVAVDAGQVSITTISTTNSTGTDYVTGDVIVIFVNFESDVDVTGSATLALNNGATAIYRSGSGSDVLTFVYTVGSNDAETSNLSIKNTSALRVVGSGTITGSTSGNDANLTIPYRELSLNLNVIGSPDVQVAIIVSGEDTNACGTNAFNRDMIEIIDIVHGALNDTVSFLDTESNCSAINSKKRQNFVSQFVLVFPIYNYQDGDLNGDFVATIYDQVNQISSVGNLDIQIQYNSAGVLVPTLFGIAILLFSLL